jgi:hypothetical protein
MTLLSALVKRIAVNVKQKAIPDFESFDTVLLFNAQ